MKILTRNETAEFLSARDNFIILTHIRPDGDTIGSAAALCRVLRQKGKEAWVLPNEDITPRLSFLLEGLTAPEGTAPGLIAAVDIADTQLLPPSAAALGDRVDLCLDHHPSNTGYARELLLHPKAAATGEVVFQVMEAMDARPDGKIWEALYIAVATDTGCFKFSNTTIDTHIAAAVLIAYGVDYAWINRQMFDVKTKERIKLESFLGGQTEYFFDDRVALIAVTTDIQKEYSMTPNDFDGISALTTRVESVEIGIVIKQRGEKTFKISMRSTGNVNVGKLCVALGGGGHAKAAGCLLNGTFDEVKEKLIKCAGEAL